jgi:TonB family protein
MPGFEILASAAVKGTAVLAAAGAAAWLLRRRSAAARHLVWTAAAAALLALPVLSGVLPALRMPADPGGALAAFQAFSSGQVSATPAAAVAQGTAGTAAGVWRSSTDLRAWAVGIWAAGAAFGIFQMLLAWAALARVRRNARLLCVEEGAEVVAAPGVGMPMTFGVFRPTVLLPEDADEWSPERFRIVLLHELGHVRRGDVAAHLVARTAFSLYWWNPLAWHAWRQFLKERERATDDLVLHAGARASEYASHLLEVARTLQPRPATAWAAIAMARRSELEGRLVAILDTEVDRRPWGPRAAIAAAVAATVLVAPFAAIRAQESVPAEAEATIRAANAQKNHEMLDRAAAAYEKVARFDVAKTLLEKSLAIREQAGSAEYAAGLVKLGDLAVKRGQTDEAASFYGKAATLGDRPEIASALVWLGQQALTAQDRSQAEALFGRVLNVETKGPNAGRAYLYLGLMRQSQFWRDDSGAELYFQKSLAADPDAPQTLVNYARMMRRQNRVEEAEAMEQKAHVVLPPSDGLEAAVSSKVYRVGNGVTAPSLLFKSEPEYTEAARKAKYQGIVLLYVEVTPEGTAQNITVRRSLGLGLDEKAIEAVKRWRFKPGTKDGQPVTVAATIEINFRLL